MPWQTTTMFLVSLVVSAVCLIPENGRQLLTTYQSTFFTGEKSEIPELKKMNDISGRSIEGEVQDATNQMRMFTKETAKGTKHFSELAARIFHEANMRKEAEQEMRKAITNATNYIGKFVYILRRAIRTIERTERNAESASKETDLLPNASSERLLGMENVLVQKLREISEQINMVVKALRQTGERVEHFTVEKWKKLMSKKTTRGTGQDK